MKIVSFCYAGGNQYCYNQIIKGKHLGVIFSRSKYNCIDELCDDIVSRMAHDALYKQPYCIYGHSMGALIGYLVSKKLQEKKMIIPKKLIISGKGAPSLLREDRLSDLPGEKFWDAIIGLGGIPNQVNNYPELIEYYLPILRHDIKLVEDFKFVKKPKLNIPIDVFYGTEEATEEEMLGWKDESTEKVTITRMKGNHFFIFEHIDFFTDYFNNIENG